MACETSPLLESKKAPNMSESPQSFYTARSRQSGTEPDDLNNGAQLPQAIAHRGYKAEYPENTLRAFSAAVEVGAHAIETDIRLSRDQTVVLSHDATLKRCFGVKKNLAECDWDYLSGLETLAEPKQHMPRLVDLLEYLAQPENEKIWLLLDIKRDDDPDQLLSATAAAIASVNPSRPWAERIVLGPWSSHVIDLCKQYFPGFYIVLITPLLPEANRMLHESDVGFNMLQPTLLGPSGSRFIEETRTAQRALFVWTVNKEMWMYWSIRKRVDGVITDDPKKFMDACEKWTAGGGERETTLRLRLAGAWLRLLMIIFGPLLRYLVRKNQTRSAQMVVPAKA